MLHLIFPMLAAFSPLVLPTAFAAIPEYKPTCALPYPQETKTYTLTTTHGDISVWDSGGDGKPVIFLHGNSCCKEVFAPQFNSNLAIKYRFIAIDLPGHGQSAKAVDPEKTYCFDGYSEVLIELIQKIKLENPAVIGWSLGGHIALNALAKDQKFAGILITGTPPIELTPAGFEKGFLPVPELMKLWSKINFTKEDAILFLTGTNTRIDFEKDPFLLDAVLKTDGLCRSYLSASIVKKTVANQKTLVETNATPLCIVLGKNDKVNLTYVTKEVKYKNLFNGKVYEIEDAGHAVFWEQPETFNAILSEFLSKTL